MKKPVAQYQPFNHVAFRGDDPESAQTYIIASPNWGYPMGYKGRINGEEVADQGELRAEYFAIIKEVHQ